MKSRYILLITMLLGSLLLVYGCSNPNPYSETRQLLKENEKKWTEQSQLFKQDYTYTLRILCFCPTDITSPVVITVVDGAPDSIAYESDGQSATDEVFQIADTVEELFDVIGKAIADKVDELTVEYDPILGYPKQITINPIKEAVDEERAYTVVGFAILK